MAKGLNFKEAIIKKLDGKLIIENELGTFDLGEEINKFTDVEFVNFKLGKMRKKSEGSSGRPKAIKYVCPECGKKISSSEEDLQVLCKICNVLYQPE